MAETDMNQQEKITLKEIYERDGVALIPGVFSQEEVNAIRAEALMSLVWSENHANHRRVLIKTLDRMVNGKQVTFPALSMWPTITSTYLDEIRKDPRLVEIATTILGPDLKQLNNQFYFRLPGDEDEFAWHQDILFRIPKEYFPGIETAYLQTSIVVDELTEENGAVEYVKGSHKAGDLELIKRGEDAPAKLRQFNRRQFIGEKILAKPGDVLIWSVMIVHGSEKNMTPFPRMNYMNGFAKSDASVHFPVYTKGGVVQDLDVTTFPENSVK